jgi:hypothetical protein
MAQSVALATVQAMAPVLQNLLSHQGAISGTSSLFPQHPSSTESQGNSLGRFATSLRNSRGTDDGAARNTPSDPPANSAVTNLHALSRSIQEDGSGVRNDAAAHSNISGSSALTQHRSAEPAARDPASTALHNPSGTDVTGDVGKSPGTNTASAELPLFSKTGISSSSLPNLHIVAPELKKDVLSGKHVNLAKLLIPNYTEYAPREMVLGASSISLKPLSDSRLDKPLTVNEFIIAFEIYMDIVTTAYPNRRAELDAYLSDIIKLANRYPGFRFYEYHTAFSQKAAQYLSEKGIKINWGERDHVLFTEFFSGQTPNSCSLCHSIIHSTRFCPQA